MGIAKSLGKWLLCGIAGAAASIFAVFLLARGALPGAAPYVLLGGLVLGLAVGALIAGVRWWYQKKVAAAAGAFVLVAAIALLAYFAWPGWSPLFRPHRERARANNCLSNLKQIGTGIAMYALDYDEVLPVCTTATQLVGVHHDVLEELRNTPRKDWPRHAHAAWMGGGAIHPYTKDSCIFFCPSDPVNHDRAGRPNLNRLPEPGVSYTWNAAVAGRKLDDVPPGTWWLSDRKPWHSGGWNMGFADGSAKWQQALLPRYLAPSRKLGFTERDYDLIQRGMSKQQVLTILGPPGRRDLNPPRHSNYASHAKPPPPPDATAEEMAEYPVDAAEVWHWQRSVQSIYLGFDESGTVIYKYLDY